MAGQANKQKPPAFFSRSREFTGCKDLDIFLKTSNEQVRSSCVPDTPFDIKQGCAACTISALGTHWSLLPCAV